MFLPPPVFAPNPGLVRSRVGEQWLTWGLCVVEIRQQVRREGPY